MIDFDTRDALPKDDFGRIALPHTIIDTAEADDMGPLLNSGLARTSDKDNDYNNLINKLRGDYYECCTFLLDNRKYETYGDDSGDYQNAAAEIACMLQATFGQALWHTEMHSGMIDELNLWLNCADEDHCIHQFAIDGPHLWLDSVSCDWESCPNMYPTTGI